jgi:hypothetical protein
LSTLNFPAKLEVFSVGVFKGLTERGDFRVVPGFQSGNFGGECGDGVVVAALSVEAGSGGGLCCRRWYSIRARSCWL